MIPISLQTASVAVLQIFAMGAVGYALVRRNIVDDAGLKLLSFLSVNISFPLFIFNQIIRNFDPLHMPSWWGFPLINIGVSLFGLMVSSLLLMRHSYAQKNEFRAAASLHNAGYIPVLLALALPLGAMAGQIYASVIISIIGFDLCLWSLGVWLLTRDKNPWMDLRQMINPPLMSMVLAIMIVFAGGAHFLSEQMLKPVKILGDSAMAIAMLVIGGNLAKTALGKVPAVDILGVILLKLVVLPLAMLVFLIFLKPPPVFAFVAMVQASMPTSVSLSVIGRYHDTNSQQFINQSIFFTHLVSILTIPIFLTLYGRLVN